MRRLAILATAMSMVFVFSAPAMAQPANDDLAAATAVTALPFADSVDTTAASTETDEPTEDEFCPPRGSTVWYALTLGSGQSVKVDTAGSDYDTTLAVYTGTNYSDLALVDCNDDTFFGLQAALTFEAQAGVTYLIQVGSFGGDSGGNLELSIGEPGKLKGKPIIFKSQFRGLVADAFVEEFDESTGLFTFHSATLMDGQAKEGGKPSKFSTLFVSSFSESFDESTGMATFTEWFGAAELSRDQFAIDRKLRSAWVMTDLTLEGFECTGSFEGEFTCMDLGPAEVTADLSWDGVGGVQKSQFKEKSSFDGVRFMFRGKFSSREADVMGGLSGDTSVDFSGAFGSINQQTTGDFIMVRGGTLP